nr:hypothetical protein [Tanacetum cinerariifolium]
EVPKELPKVSMVNSSLKKLKFHLASFDMAVEQHCVEKNKFQDKMKDVLKENERLLEQAISTYIVNIVVNANVNYACKTVNECERCVTIETELRRDFIKKECCDKFKQNVRPSLHNKKSVVNTKAISSVPNSKLNVNSDLKCATSNGCLFFDNHDSCVLKFINSMNARVKPTSAKKPVNRKIWKPTRKVVQIVLWYLNSGCSKHMTEDHSQLINFVHKFLGTVKFENDHVAKIMGYGDYKIGNVTSSRVYFMEGLGHNLFSVGQLCDLVLKVAYRQHTCFIRNLDGASKTKSWLWHRRLSHLNFGAINHLARQGLVRGLPKLKFEKDHLCSACAMGKSKKKSHKPKSEDTNQEKLFLLHMDLCVPMHVESVNGKKYILVIVDDYSRFTWVKCLRSKDEAPDFIIKFLKMIQVRLKVPVRRI